MTDPRPIRTVLGDVAAGDLGVTYACEHLIIDPVLPPWKQPPYRLGSVDAAAAELARFREAGGRSVFESTPCDAGRNVLKLAEASRRSGVHIVAPTGLLWEEDYPAGHWSHRYSAEALAALFIADIEDGIDRFDYAGPLVSRTGHRAGIIMVAAGKIGLTEHQRKLFHAASIAHAVTGAPVVARTKHGAGALQQIGALRAGGVDPSAVTICHSDQVPDIAYQREILSTGVRVCYDGAFRWRVGQPNHTLGLITRLVREFPDRIMLGMSAARHTYWHAHGGEPGLGFLLTTFSAMLRDRGVTGAQRARLFVANPAGASSLRPPDPGREIGTYREPAFVPPS